MHNIEYDFLQAVGQFITAISFVSRNKLQSTVKIKIGLTVFRMFQSPPDLSLIDA